MYRLSRLSRSRGFKLIRPSLRAKLQQMQVKFDWKPIEDLVRKAGLRELDISRFHFGTTYLITAKPRQVRTVFAGHHD